MVNQHTFENSHYKLLRNIVNQISDIDHWMPESVSIGIPYIMTGDFDSTNLIKYDTAKKISNDDYLKLSKRIKPEYGDIIFARYASVGAVRFIDTIRPFLVSYSCAIIKPYNSVMGKYLYYYLQSAEIQKQIEIAINAGTQKNVGLNSLSNFLIYVPDEDSIDKIVEILSDTDCLISSLQKLIEKKKAIKQGALQELLTGKKRLPGFNEEWEELNFAESAKLKARIGWQGLTTSEYLQSGYAYLITGTDFHNGRIKWETCHFVDEKRYKQDLNIQIKKHDILLTKDGTIGKVAYISNVQKPTTLNSGVFVIRPAKEDSFDPNFVYHILNSFLFDNFLAKLSAGSTINHLYQKDFVDFTFKAPSELVEQQAIAQVLSDMDSEIDQLEKKLAKYQQIKQGMMQELLTGRIRLV